MFIGRVVSVHYRLLVRRLSWLCIVLPVDHPTRRQSCLWISLLVGCLVNVHCRLPVCRLSWLYILLPVDHLSCRSFCLQPLFGGGLPCLWNDLAGCPFTCRPFCLQTALPCSPSRPSWFRSRSARRLGWLCIVLPADRPTRRSFCLQTTCRPFVRRSSCPYYEPIRVNIYAEINSGRGRIF